jgi:hypothetical protein
LYRLLERQPARSQRARRSSPRRGRKRRPSCTRTTGRKVDLICFDAVITSSNAASMAVRER